MDYSSGSGVVATQTAVLYLPRGRLSMSAQVPVLGGKGGGSGWGGDLSGFICQADTAAELWPRSWRNRRACVTCAGARLRKEGLSNKSRKSKITPVRINSGRGEIV